MVLCKIIHALEASFNFRGHLITEILFGVAADPCAKRILIRLPPSDWISSARDALEFEQFTLVKDWSLPSMLYLMESYNGFGYRARKIKSPYLWSLSNLYSKGKFVSDGSWDPKAVSQQCGGAVILKSLVEGGQINLQAG